MQSEDHLSTEIMELKKDVTEILDLLRILSGFVQMPEPGTEEEKTAIEFETRLGTVIDKHVPRHLSKQMDAIAIEAEVMQIPPASRVAR
jgi:hypothetical protein